jgi:hypothetical protein
VLLFAMYLLVVILLPVALSAIIGARQLPCGSGCPNCSEETLPLLSVPLRAVGRVYAGIPVQRRWCPACEWDGYARSRTPSGVLERNRETTLRHTEPVRTLELNGRVWKVMLESWREQGLCYGRLLFVGPSGKQWREPMPEFSADTAGEVLVQARSLSDRLLAHKLMEVISG